MEKEGNNSGNFPGPDHSLQGHDHQELMKPHIGATSADDTNQMVDYMLHNPPKPPLFSNVRGSNLFDKLSTCPDVMQFSDFGPMLALNQIKNCDEETGFDPVYYKDFSEEKADKGLGDKGDHEARMEENYSSAQLRFLGENLGKRPLIEAKSKRKRPRSTKTSEEAESQRMTHIAVERNRRKQMNEHLSILKSLMPNSYVQRGDQASIIGGAIEFVRELEQLLQCLESQKRRRLYGENDNRLNEDPPLINVHQHPQQPLIFPTNMSIPNDQVKLDECETGLREETAEIKSCLADVEVKLLGLDGLIKILSRRRPGQLIKTIAAIEDLQISILHTNVTTIEQTVLYSFNVKISGESRFTAEDIANSIQQILSFIQPTVAYDETMY